MKQTFMAITMVLLAASCGHKTYQCPFSYYRVSGRLAFVGFTAAELNTIYINSYYDDPGQELSSSYTVTDGIAYLQHDTAFLKSDNTRNLGISSTYFYTVSIPATGSVFQITGIAYKPEKDSFYLSSLSCRGNTLLVAPDSAFVNGKVIYPGPDSNRREMYYLHR